MIIAIDETGDFSPESELQSFFIAVLIDQSNNGLEIKKKQFDEWKKSISKEKINEKNEIKGSDLDDNELLSFVENVYNSAPILRKQIVTFFPKENPESLMKVFKEREVNNLLNASETAKNSGKERLSIQYKRMAIWHKNAKKMHYPHFFKLILLRFLITEAFRTSVGVSILLERLHDKKNENLLNLNIKIDQDFVRGDDPNIYWKELLRNYFMSMTNERPIPALENWKVDGHPFMDKYKHSSSATLNFKELFKNNCNFLESHENFEIQLADITGIIVNRFHNRNKAVEAYNAFYKILNHQSIHKIVLDNEPNFDVNPMIME